MTAPVPVEVLRFSLQHRRCDRDRCRERVISSVDTDDIASGQLIRIQDSRNGCFRGGCR